ncbi:asparagine synthetase B [Bacillus wiedmannii]|uniref:lasso peptide isopeptide bond-forming cyclase n=1 Tax=Bacillus TaxID=1386 RepID=UPI000779F8CA|nr:MULTISPECIES: lasso peptide isopeptide bond-forming cyclase [Bacillus cereus group]KXY81408.1 asparagine synthetase B [Bacillus wiedmannii]PEW72061.1 asparagine synthetase B [Bacillus cereus]MDG1622753.1 lasso peptide isopeptide bond-forming cyclase [Bacillus mobilis]MDX5839582.1 lasso peptide isopeptide bond-forming cyclase [Bacillus cereus group sp. BfR-BA-01700]MED4385806.1 lasso peptide isopeptide bond-forming cyclase [Bacillus mobilis]
MSAIAGIIHFNNEPVSIEHGRGLMGCLSKYPADDIRIWHKEHIFFGCHAQWITPESIGEQLPYYDVKSKLIITADAIIDNRTELFDRLQVDNVERKGIADSELILRAYQKWGEESPKYLVGDFAFMIWDERNQKLFGARDFSGSRTLYYFRDHQRFAFCTIISPLLSLPYVRKELNELWLAEYLAVSGMIDAVDTSITPYKHIEQVPPAHSIVIDKNKIKLMRYCTLTVNERLELKSNEEYIEAFQEVFQKAVDDRLRTNLNVGAQLSGGLDSGAVVSFAVNTMRKENKRLHTFSYIPPHDFVDFTPKQLVPNESVYIKSTIEYVGGVREHYLDFKGKNSYSEIDSFLEILETPYKFFENSFWLKGMFEKAHEEGVGVLLNGDRGNFTISWGYALEYYAILLKKLKWIRLYKELNQYSKNTGGDRLRRIPDIFRIGFPAVNRIFSQNKVNKKPMLINPKFAKNTRIFEKFKEYGLEQTGWYSESNIYEERRKHFEDVFHWNAGSTLAAKLSLRYGLWKRDPTNDIRVIRFCLSVPEEQYVQNGLDRALIRRSTEKMLPDKIRLNQKTRGVQGVDWVHRMMPYWKTFIDEIEQLSVDETALEYLNGQVIKEALYKVREDVSPENAINFDYKVLMRSLIVYRYIKTFI